MATAHAGSQAVGDVPETDRTALSGVHHHKTEQQVSQIRRAMSLTINYVPITLTTFL
jgi:hypothetical protein